MKYKRKCTHKSHLAINVLKYEAMERRISEDTERNPYYENDALQHRAITNPELDDEVWRKREIHESLLPKSKEQTPLITSSRTRPSPCMCTVANELPI